MKYPKYLYIIIFSQLLFAGCSNFGSKKIFNEGSIEYSILFEENAQSSFNSSFLPNKIVIKFRDNNTSNKIEGMSGAFNLTYINNIDDGYSKILVKVLNKKLYYEEPIINGGLPSTYAGMPKITIKETNDTIRFQGFICKKAIASFDDSLSNPFEILYTNEIKIDKPNANTPFEAIDGVMLKFNVKLYKHIMSISATAIKPEHISMDDFAIPADYVKVSKKTIEDLLSLLQ